MSRLIGYIYKSNAKAASEKKIIAAECLEFVSVYLNTKAVQISNFPCHYINYK